MTILHKSDTYRGVYYTLDGYTIRKFQEGLRGASVQWITKRHDGTELYVSEKYKQRPAKRKDAVALIEADRIERKKGQA